MKDTKADEGKGVCLDHRIRARFDKAMSRLATSSRPEAYCRPNASSFTGTISGLAQGDAIDFAHQSVTAANPARP
jgi:hypothetical protein